MNNLNNMSEFKEYALQELSLDEQKSINGGSLFTYLVGAAYGATLGALVNITNYMYYEQYGYPPKSEMA